MDNHIKYIMSYILILFFLQRTARPILIQIMEHFPVGKI